MKKIEIFYFDACPTWRQTAADVERLLAEAHIEADVKLVEVTSDEAARSLRFLGSPTVRVDGVDVDASARDATTFGMQCRVYDAGGRLVASPPMAWIRTALGI